jgi:hypothetical protein
MRVSGNERAVVNDLVEEVMDEMRGEPFTVQIKVAIAILAIVVASAAKQDREEMKRAAQELQTVWLAAGSQ